MDEGGNIHETRFEKTIVTNKVQLTYKEAQEIIDEKTSVDKKIRKKHDLNGSELKELKRNLKKLK